MAMTRIRSRWTAGLLAAGVLVTAGCGGTAAGAAGPAATGSLPPGVMSAAQACRRVVEGPRGQFLTGIERVHLVLTTYAKGEPAESGGDISTGMPPRTLVWVVEVHARAISGGDYPGPIGFKPPTGDDYSVVMNARTGLVTDSGVDSDWPLPLWKAGAVVSLPPQC
jgi:hypothetical protein